MAKKPQTPPPPRKVQAPQARRDAPDPRRSRMILYAAAASGILALVIVVAVLAATGGGSGGSGGGGKGLTAAMTAAGCDFKTVDASLPKGQGTHENSLTKPLAQLGWNTNPPSNGQHYPLWAVWGFYTQAVNPRQVVHNLEHGGVVIWWGSKVPKATVDKLNAFYSDDPGGMFGTPYAQLGGKIGISAWTGDTAKYGHNGYYGQGHVATCSTWNAKTEKAFKAFRDAYRGKGPEGVPLSQDQPGMGPQ